MLIAYLLGSIPTGFLVAKARGVDIRTVGSGNIGATNVFRILGKPAGVLVLLADAAKGWLAVVVVAKLVSGWFYPDAGSTAREWFRHLRRRRRHPRPQLHLLAPFQGRQGHRHFGRRAGGAGAGAAADHSGHLDRRVRAEPLCVARLDLRLVCPAVRRLGGSGKAGPSSWSPPALAALAIYKHKANIQRLLNGTENRIGRRTPIVR